MADITTALAIVGETQDKVIEMRRRPNIDQARYDLLWEAELALEKLRNRLVAAHNRASIRRIREDAKSLGKIVKKMKEEVEGLKRIARHVERAAEAAKLAAAMIETAAKLAAL